VVLICSNAFEGGVDAVTWLTSTGKS